MIAILFYPAICCPQNIVICARSVERVVEGELAKGLVAGPATVAVLQGGKAGESFLLLLSSLS